MAGPKAQGTAASHGSALGDDEIRSTKVALGLNPDESFAMPADVLAHARCVKEHGAQARKAWDARFESWKAANTDKAVLLERLRTKTLPAGWDSDIPVFAPGKDVATRAASGEVINAIAAKLPEFSGEDLQI
jgi:transketolase